MLPMPTYNDFEGVNNLVIDQRGYAEVIRCLADRTLKSVVNWCRYGELFAYDEGSETLSLENPA